MKNTLRSASLCALMFAAAALTSAADWPMWRCDAGRRGASSEGLPDSLSLQWSRRLPSMQMAWPNEPRVQFDASYEPVVMGARLFLGSPNDGSVRAFDTQTGEQQWVFYTEGPVRLAPVAWQGKVYFGSDDGWLYCVDAASGQLRWKVRGAPDDRPDCRHLGNARLISYWPVRGGPVLVDGTLYFAAGIWPTQGVFVVAVDAQTGQRLWVNSGVSFLDNVRIDHNTLFQAGLAPEGYLAVVGDKLIVPNGRSQPAALDRRSGKLLYYVQGYRHGHWRLASTERYIFVGNTAVLNINDGREMGSRWVEAGKDAPDRFDPRKWHLFEGPIHNYKTTPALNARSVFDGNMAFGMQQGTLYCRDLSQAKQSIRPRKMSGRELDFAEWGAPTLWALAAKPGKKLPATVALIKAGSRVYGHAGKLLLAFDLPSQGAKSRVAWEYRLDGTPSSMIAADGKLFVVTRERGLYCFGSEKRQSKAFALEAKPLPKPHDAWTRTAADTLARSGVTEGYALVLGLQDGRLVEELLRQSKLRVIAVDADAGKVNALRDKLAAAGVYGTRAEAFVGKPFDFGFPPYIASLVVSEGLASAGFSTQMPAARLFRVLRPYGGGACFAMPAARQQAFAQWAESANLPNAKVESAGEFVTLRRVGALLGSADWTHESATPARTYFSTDELVEAPLGVLWYGDGPDYGFYKFHDYGIGVKPQVAGGRLFAYQIFSRTLQAYDVYTGRLLWKHKVKYFTRYASMPDAVYVAGANRCEVLDPATAKAKATFTFHMPDGLKAFVADILVTDDVIVVALAHEKVRCIEKGLWDATSLVALDRGTGEELWRRQAQERFNAHSLSAGAGMVFCVDSRSPRMIDNAKRRGEQPKELPCSLLALDARTGAVKWQAVTTNPYRLCPAMGHWCSIRANDDWTAYVATHGLLLNGKFNNVRAYDAATGTEVWHKRIGGGQPFIVRGDTFITQSGHEFDAHTGDPVRKGSLFARAGCNYAVGGEHLLFVRDHSVCYVDLATGERRHLRNIRSGCSNSLVAADGLLNAPCFSVHCVCNYPIQTSFALVHMPEAAGWETSKPLDLRAKAR